jgi:hypothetical protein
MGRFPTPKGLVVATNYEECVYMYYLGCRTILGGRANNVDQDMKMDPDVIVRRKAVNSCNTQDLLKIFYDKQRYEKISFPVADYFFNNIPELESQAHQCRHLFYTPHTEEKDERLDIYIKTKNRIRPALTTLH